MSSVAFLLRTNTEMRRMEGGMREMKIGVHKHIATSGLLSPSILMSEDEWKVLTERTFTRSQVDLSKATLLFRASVDGFDSGDFHRKCDGKGETLTVVRTEYGSVCGAFTSVMWSTDQNWHSDPKPFLFLCRSLLGIVFADSTFIINDYEVFLLQ